MERYFFLFLSLGSFWAGPVLATDEPQASASVSAPAATAVAKPAEKPVAPVVIFKREGNLLYEETGLKNFDAVSMQLSTAQLHVRSGIPQKKSLIRVERVRGSIHCDATVTHVDGKLVVEEKTESQEDSDKAGRNSCLYAVRLELHEPLPLEVELAHFGDVELEQWDDAASFNINHGNVSFSHIGDLNVKCQSCDLSGEDVDGELKYNVGFGSVGVTQLTASVEGQSRGDVVLKWRKLRAQSKIKVETTAGDIFLSLPRAYGLALDLKAKRGEVRTKIESMSDGTPIAALTEVGNIHVVSIKTTTASSR